MHIQAQYVHIPYIHRNTMIYVITHTYTNLQAIGAMVRGGSCNKNADTCIYVHIHAYTYSVRIFFRSTYICLLYVNILHIRSYTCKVKNGDLGRVPKKIHVYYMYFDVSARIWFSILYVYWTYTRILYVYDSIDAPSNFSFRKYVTIRVYVQIRAIYITYTYNIWHWYVHIKHDIHQ